MISVIDKDWKQKTIDEKLEDIAEFQIYAFGLLLLSAITIGIKVGMM